jgi:hypothetical protein
MMTLSVIPMRKIFSMMTSIDEFVAGERGTRLRW